MRIERFILWISIFIPTVACLGQDIPADQSRFPPSLVIYTDTSFYTSNFIRTTCKGCMVLQYGFAETEKTVIEPNEKVSLAPVAAMVSMRIPKLLPIHGNIYYDFIYRLVIDTPVNQKNFLQPTERIDPELMVKKINAGRLKFFKYTLCECA